MKHVIIYSHGFGVRKDDRGLMTDIAAGIPEAEHILFDYNAIDEQAHTLTVAPLQNQALRLEEVVQKAVVDHPDATIDIVAHSQGCVVAALAKPLGIRKVMLMAPPTELHAERMIKPFATRAGSEIDMKKTSKLARRDGTITVVPAQYWKSLAKLDPIALYQDLISLAQVAAISAEHDEVLGPTSFDGLDRHIDIETLPTNHDFTNVRPQLISLIKRRLI